MTTTTTGVALKSRQRAREQRLASARERRLRLDPDRLAREQRIDEATIDVEDAWEALTEAQAAVEAAELTVAAGIERLVAEKLTVAEVADLTGLDQATVRRLRQVKASTPAAGADGPGSPA
jgi:hypothetical protein